MGDYLVKISNILTTAGAAVCLAALSTPASAAWVAGNSTLTFNDSDPGLVVYANPIAFSGSLPTVGSSFTTQVMSIGTNESTINLLEDLVPYDFTALFTFASPFGAGSQLATGTTSGTFSLNPLNGCNIYFAGGCGQLSWSSNPMIVDFDGGGQFSLSLSNATFGTPGQAGVNGTFTLLAAVPEPSTWAMLILGFGAVGFMMRSRRRQNVSVSYA